jgi:hypothetical protein
MPGIARKVVIDRRLVTKVVAVRSREAQVGLSLLNQWL